MIMNIPEYSGGVRSPEIYNAGVGLADTRVIDGDPDFVPCFHDGEKMSEPEFRAKLTELDKDGWNYSFQYGLGGTTSIKIVRDRRTIDITYLNGSVSVRFADAYLPSPQPAVIQTTYTGTNPDEYTAHIEKMKAAGFDRVFSNRVEGNLFDEFQTEDGLLRYSYTNGTVRVSEDRVSLPVSAVSDDAPEGKTIVYQYGLHHTQNRGGFTMDCGMCYAAKLPDGSVFMIDGGYFSQCSMDAVNGLMELLHRLGGEKIRLTWFCTHAHDDHIDMFSKILRLYHDEIELQRVLFNFPDDTVCGSDAGVFTMINRVRKYYPNVKYRKIRAGDKLNIGGCPIDVLLTHEMATGAVGNEPIGWMNDTSTVIKLHLDPAVTNGDADFMVLGDMDNSAEAVLLSMYSEKTLHSGMVQAAHHLFNLLKNVYRVIGADIAVVPQSEKQKTNHDKPKYLNLLQWIPSGSFYFSDSGTDGFEVKNGRIAHIFHEERKGGVHDGSPL